MTRQRNGVRKFGDRSVCVTNVLEAAGVADVRVSPCAMSLRLALLLLNDDIVVGVAADTRVRAQSWCCCLRSRPVMSSIVAVYDKMTISSQTLSH